MKIPIFLIGPTAVGKTEIAVILAGKINAEIVSADSMQVYRGMDIATAKPDVSRRRGIRHHLIDIVDFRESYDVARYVHLARQIMAGIRERGKKVLVVGGSGLYIKGLIDGLFSGPAADEETRKMLALKLKETGLSLLYQELQQVDPLAAARINPSDKRRIIRALEVYYQTGKSISSLQRQWGEKKSSGDYVIIGLNRERKDLYQRIDQRVEEMFCQGLVAETERLLAQGLRQYKVSFQALGYKEIGEYLDGKSSLAEAKEKLKQKTRNFAKRQLTWFRKDGRVKWFMIDKEESAEKTAARIYETVIRPRAALLRGRLG